MRFNAVFGNSRLVKGISEKGCLTCAEQDVYKEMRVEAYRTHDPFLKIHYSIIFSMMITESKFVILDTKFFILQD